MKFLRSFLALNWVPLLLVALAGMVWFAIHGRI